MIKKVHIEQLIGEHLSETDRFLVKLSVGTDNRINIYIDGDSGVTIDHCVDLSRFIEQQLDRDTEDFELNISSAGVDQPFVNLRQYAKNIGLPVEIILMDGSNIRGVLRSADESTVVLDKEKKSKKKKSKKMVTGEEVQILMSEIQQTKTIIIF